MSANSIKLALPMQMLTKLIAESSPEVKMEIQDHILKTVLKNQFTCRMPDSFSDACKKYIDEVASEYFVIPGGPVGYNRGSTLKPSIVAKLRKQATDAFRSAGWEEAFKPTREELDAKLAEVIEGLKLHVESALERWTKTIDAHLEKRVNETLVTYIDSAVDAKFKLRMVQWEADQQKT